MILDIGMPDVTGYEIARSVRAQPWGRHALLLAVTGWGQPEDKERSSGAGFDHHLTKPVDPSQIEQLLADYSRQLQGRRVSASGHAFAEWDRGRAG